MVQRIGFWGLVALGVIGVGMVYAEYGISDLLRYVAPASLFVVAGTLRAIGKTTDNPGSG